MIKSVFNCKRDTCHMKFMFVHVSDLMQSGEMQNTEYTYRYINRDFIVINMLAYCSRSLSSASILTVEIVAHIRAEHFSADSVTPCTSFVTSAYTFPIAGTFPTFCSFQIALRNALMRIFT